MAQTVLHQAATRGKADLGWLKTYHTFSFSRYYDPERIHFGALRVLNDDTVIGGAGFGEHPHDNMEIITLLLEGSLKHRDSMGNEAIINQGEIQVMSAGTGIHHSEFNGDKTALTKLLQIWIFPKTKNVTPRYDQQKINFELKNEFIQILSPNKEDNGVWIHQDAWFNWANFEANYTDTYRLQNVQNGVYLFVVKGSVTVNDTLLNEKDGLGIWATDSLAIKANTDSQFLVMEVPMDIEA